MSDLLKSGFFNLAVWFKVDGVATFNL